MPSLRLAIIGVGLIGGSLGLCLKDKMGDDIYITGMCRTQKSMDKAVETVSVALVLRFTELKDRISFRLVLLVLRKLKMICTLQLCLSSRL